MAVDSRSLDFEDPFSGSSLLSLLPRTLGVPPHADAPPSEEQEMKSIQDFLDSFILSGSKTVLEQAQAICNSSQEVVDPSREEKMISPDGKDRLLGRRPALGRKRPRFSLKPIPSNSIPDVDFNSQIDHLDDPEEYFMAFDQLENADKELKKLRGEIPNEHSNNQHIIVRKHRPGILGKRASFKHQSSGMVAFNSSQDLDRTAMPLEVSKSNEKSNHTLSGQAGNLDSMEPSNKVSIATEQEDSAGDKENNGNNLLEKLLCSFKDLDEAEGTALLKESLQIKSVDVGKMCLPELDNSRKNDNKALKDVVRKQSEARQHKQKSPAIGTSPLAAISNLLRRTSVNDLMENPYLNFPSDGARDGGDFTPASCQQKKSVSPTVELEVSCPDPLVRDTSMSPMSDNTSSSLVDKLPTPVTKTDKINDDNIVAEEEETESGHQLHENTTRHGHHEMTEEQSNSEGFNKQIKDKAEQIQLDQLSDQPDPGVGGLASCCVNNHGLASTLGITDEDHMISGKDKANTCGIVDISQTQVNVGTSIESSVGPCKDNSTHQTTVLPLDEQHKGVSISAGEDVQKHGYANSGISQNNRKSQKASSRSKNKKEKEWFSKRKSLAGAGTNWQSGVRRSTRRIMRPLQYWRGERFLYGRIHNSLATVIGVKYCSSSPGQDGEMQVESYVSEQYADLVAQAARY